MLAVNGSRPEVIHADQDVYDDGYFRIDHTSYYVAFNGRALSLPCKEFLVLSRLSRNIGRTVPSETLWQDVWGQDKVFSSGSLKVYVHNLRRKIMPFGLNIQSRISVGYYLTNARQENCTTPNSPGTGNRT